jgi:hypothetical protein
MASGKILVAQGGGPTAVINQSLVGVALEARRFGEVTRIYGARHGVRGIVDEDFVDLTQETSHNLELVANTPSSALGSTRDKPDVKYCQDIFKVLQAHEIEHFFYIGGNDSSDTVRIVSLEAQKAGYPLRSIHIPKTIDNDLVGNDHTLCGAGLCRRQPRQRGAARRVRRRGDGPPCRVFNSCICTRQKISRRRPAFNLPARAHLRAGQFSGRREGHV